MRVESWIYFYLKPVLIKKLQDKTISKFNRNSKKNYPNRKKLAPRKSNEKYTYAS